ncbi:hypothetical protein ABZ532_08180 [Streptomyces sp. NPDC019396]|uniref:hypothetical protein n=1 Tax=Streptomyces sp. NPDC019396 TaxID=3154687 RepID=UPI0034091447
MGPYVEATKADRTRQQHRGSAVHAELSSTLFVSSTDPLASGPCARRRSRLGPGSEPPERHLERQLGLLHAGAERLTTGLREQEARRQQTYTRYPEGRDRSGSS